ncbi:hypothetical protein ID871_02165 [Streptomyces pratensis]|nr:hypothetical protein [Streptomyces pratensis]
MRGRLSLALTAPRRPRSPYGSNTCADDATTTFLTTGERPPRDLFCAAEPAS